jgi:phosphoglycerate kinase
MGVFEEDQYALGTKIVGKAMTETPGFSVVGGGDTETALTQFNLESGIDFISTGGGAMLEYLTQSTLPALEALE